MNNLSKVSPKFTVIPVLMAIVCSIITLKTLAHDAGGYDFFANLTVFQQIDTTVNPLADTIPLKDTVNNAVSDTLPPRDTSVISVIDTLNLKISQDSLDAVIKYSASDSIVFDRKTNQVILYGKATTEYKDLTLSAEKLIFDQSTQIVTATHMLDTAGMKVGLPQLVQGDQSFTADTIVYNFKTQKGITRNTYTQQGEMFVSSEKVKKISDAEYFMYRGTVTTCNFDIPHFGFVANKMKLVKDKFAITGPVHPEFEGVPIPIYLPFGIFPLKQGRHSGLLAPSFSAAEQFGLGLEGLGYYKVLNDYFDVTLLTNIYSYGGWSMSLQPTYRKRYRYNGGLTFRLQNTKINFKGDPDFVKSRTFNIAWNHTVDGKARPGTNFSASVNAGSTKFNQYAINNPLLNFQNQLSSSITYSKNWDGKNLTISANHNQNNNQRLVNLNLPDVGFTVSTFYPFQKKELVGQPKWYEKLGVGLNTNLRSQVSFYDSAFSFRQIIDTFQWGASHNIPISLSLPPVGPIQMGPSISFDERWYAQKFIRVWNDQTQKLDTVIQKGFYAARQMSFGFSLNTAIFGVKEFRNSRLMAIRHVIRPNIGLNYKPDMMKPYYYETQVDADGRRMRFSHFDGSIFGAFGEGTFGGMSFGVDNNLEAKVRSKTDTAAGAFNKIRLIDGFGFNGSYNFMADSFQLSNISLYLRSTLFEKINITANANIDPYQLDATGFRVNRLAWSGDRFSVGRITGGGMAISTSFSSKSKVDGKEEEIHPDEDELGPLTSEEQQLQLEYARRNPAEFADFNVPWSVNLSFSLNFSRVLKPDYSGFETILNSSLNLGGDFNLTPRWKAGANGFFDFNSGTIQSFTMFITRELHCWQMAINLTPVGLYRSFNITISPKSGLLRDLKINRTRYFYTNPGF